VADPNAPYWRWRERPAGCAHMHFISLPNPYCGMWIASAAQLRGFMASPYWDQEGAMAAISSTQTTRHRAGTRPWWRTDGAPFHVHPGCLALRWALLLCTAAAPSKPHVALTSQ